jgi:hypothetical protein
MGKVYDLCRGMKLVYQPCSRLRAALGAPLIRFTGDLRHDGHGDDIGDDDSRRKICFMAL